MTTRIVWKPQSQHVDLPFCGECGSPLDKQELTENKCLNCGVKLEDGRKK